MVVVAVGVRGKEVEKVLVVAVAVEVREEKRRGG